ncbi:DUF4190 domain-containing protein [Arthrobacter sp. I2-34]|uniref:DUF4190 domain-containing protein n=1 Tax=Arthrobacter hankyongi TaxID=2904801 RepID=A0ABS9L2N4_9MICC|nr:DUF4190 domain-containing protein [Arthrobacter hankyongi]MCG2620893.1 DUF4190 domain-containing protein [Arthrobacter hankyongi]
MSNSTTGFDTPAPSAPHQPFPPAPEAKRGNGLGVAAMVVGIVSIVLSIIPILGMMAFFLGAVAVILGVIGVILKNRKKGMAITGIILGVVSLIIAGIVTAIVAAAVQAVDDSLNAEHTIEYVVKSNGAASVSYWSGDGSSNVAITKDWKKTVQTTGFDLSSVTVIGDLEGATKVSCEVFVNGESVSTNSGSGDIATASCSGTTASTK